MLYFKHHMGVGRTCMAACETRQEQKHWAWHMFGLGSGSTHDRSLALEKQPTRTSIISSAWARDRTGEFLKLTKQIEKDQTV